MPSAFVCGEEDAKGRAVCLCGGAGRRGHRLSLSGRFRDGGVPPCGYAQVVRHLAFGAMPLVRCGSRGQGKYGLVRRGKCGQGRCGRKKYRRGVLPEREVPARPHPAADGAGARRVPRLPHEPHPLGDGAALRVRGRYGAPPRAAQLYAHAGEGEGAGGKNKTRKKHGAKTWRGRHQPFA